MGMGLVNVHRSNALEEVRFTLGVRVHAVGKQGHGELLAGILDWSTSHTSRPL